MKSATTTTSFQRSDVATKDSGKVRLGDAGAPSFGPAGGARKPSSGVKVARDAATRDSGKVRLGDGGRPMFGRSGVRDR